MYQRFKDNIYVADLAKMRSLFSVKRGVKYLLCVNLLQKSLG